LVCLVGQISDLSPAQPPFASEVGVSDVSHLISRSDIEYIVKHNGDFRKNYGLFVGAFLYALSLRAASYRAYPWIGALVTALGAGFFWLWKYGWQ
jgi:hypothetical protein